LFGQRRDQNAYILSSFHATFFNYFWEVLNCKTGPVRRHRPLSFFPSNTRAANNAHQSKKPTRYNAEICRLSSGNEIQGGLAYLPSNWPNTDRLQIAARNPTTSLRCLPTEIRDMIFENILTLPQLTYLEKQPESPAIIVALRPNPELYQEALQIHYKRNTFRITSNNFAAILKLKTPYLGSIRSLMVGDL
jgi:hypothetical protein